MVFDWIFKESYEERVQAVLHFQRSRNSILDYAARFATFCSDEEFYLMMFPLLYWGPVCDVKLGWNLCICIGLGLPIGNILKNIFCIRRPSSPTLWQLHTSNEEHEFALPSTHALLASSVSLHVALHHITNYRHYEWTLLVGWLLFVLLWSSAISLSRVYMGAHSFQDIVLGGIVGAFYGLVLSIALECLHDSMVEGSSSIVIISSLLSLIIIHTHPINKSTRLNFHLSEGTFDYTSPLVGLTLGGILSRSWYFPVAKQCIATWNLDLFLRYLIGIPATIASYILIRKSLPIFLEPIFKLLRVRAHYIPYSDFAKYVTSGIKHYSEYTNGAQSEKNHTDCSNGKYSNPDYLLAWVRIYTKFFLYVALTYTVAVLVPILTGLILEKK